MDRFADIRVTPTGFEGSEDRGRREAMRVLVPGAGHEPGRQLEIAGGREVVRFSASFPLFLIGEALARGASFEDLADGFGEGRGTMGGDWSGIRDSSPAAVDAMLQRALNHLFPGAGR